MILSLYAVLDKYQKLIKSGGMLSYFEYIGVADIKKSLLLGEKKIEFSKTVEITTEFRNKYEIETATVIVNLPPAYVHHLKIEKE